MPDHYGRMGLHDVVGASAYAQCDQGGLAVRYHSARPTGAVARGARIDAGGGGGGLVFARDGRESHGISGAGCRTSMADQSLRFSLVSVVTQRARPRTVQL